MATDNATTQTGVPATLPGSLVIATRGVTYSGDANAQIAPTGLVSFAGSDDAKTATDVPLPTTIGANGGLKVDIVGDTGVASTLDAQSNAGVSLNTKAMLDGATTITPKFAVIAASTSGNNTLVAAVASKKIRVLAYNFIANGSVNAKFQSGAGGTDLTGLKYCVVNGGLVAPFNPVGWFETAVNTLLNLNLSAGVAVGGELTYVEVA